MSYTFLRKGANLPAVGVIQKLLNRTGASLTVDGDFGSKTESAVRKFQADRGMSPDGRVGKLTYPRLLAGEPAMTIVDLVDIFDPSLANLEARDILKVGGIAITIPGMSNGVEQAVAEVRAAVPAGSVFMLRVHGHGAAGIAGVSDGHGVGGEHGSSIHVDNMAYVGPLLAQLRPIFGPYGCVQFMHCKSGNGIRGQVLLDSVSSWVGVPASGAIRDQRGGGEDTFKYEGPTRTSVPSFLPLKDWCGTLPEFHGRSVP